MVAVGAEVLHEQQGLDLACQGAVNIFSSHMEPA